MGEQTREVIGDRREEKRSQKGREARREARREKKTGWAIWDYLNDTRLLEHNGWIPGAAGGMVDRQAEWTPDFPGADWASEQAGAVDSGTLEAESSIDGYKGFGYRYCWDSWI